MEIRSIDSSVITDTVKKLFMDMNYFIGEDILNALKNAEQSETSPIGKNVLAQLIENNKIAAEEEVPICQDTGMAVLFVEYGDRVVIENGSFEDAVQEGVRRAYIDGYL
ncbi:MAG: fumarate hydratase, partial [Clostridia bacterium]|nr:fumarate hydratase [Clostridia bacterium]